MTAPAPKIELWEIDKIKPYAGNAKVHKDSQVDKLATAITTFGWTQPIVVDFEGVIIAGHGRRLAAIKLGLAKVPVIVRLDLTKAEADALRLADNRVTSTDYDQELIQEELQRLSVELGESMSLLSLGFDQKEIDFVMADLGDIDDALFIEDVAVAVEEQKAENEQKIQQTDDVAAPVVDALGFKRVTIAQSRAIREAMVRIEAKTGKAGIDAFMEWIEAA